MINHWSWIIFSFFILLWFLWIIQYRCKFSFDPALSHFFSFFIFIISISISLVVVPVSLKFSSIRPYHFSFSFSFAFYKFSNKISSIFICHSSLAMAFTWFYLSFIIFITHKRKSCLSFYEIIIFKLPIIIISTFI